MDVNQLLAEIHANLPAENTGKVATYIPELAKVDPNKFGVHAVTCDQRAWAYGDSEECFRDTTIGFNETVAASERETSVRNRALIEFIRSFGNIRNETERLLDFYCTLCSLEMNCRQLAESFLFLANNGISPCTGRRIVSAIMTKRLNAIMQLCGLYDEAGEFAFRVGLPGKSGVGGGIVALRPRDYCVVVWSPPLNYKGNSQFGMAFLEGFTSKIGDSIF